MTTAALDALHAQGHLADIDRHFGRLIAELDGVDKPESALAAALASAKTRDGHACLTLSEVAGADWPGPSQAGAVRLPALDAWIEALAASPAVAAVRHGDQKRCPRPSSAGDGPEARPAAARSGNEERRPLVLDGCRLYLERLWAAEQAVAVGLRTLAGAMAPGPAEGTRSTGHSPHRIDGDPRSGSDGSGAGDGPSDGASAHRDVSGPDPDRLEAALDRVFPGTPPDDRARAAARIAMRRRLCVVSGGPGTGKTTIAASIVALLIEFGLAAPGRTALAAPTGKAAARLQEAVRARHRKLVSRVPALEGYEAEATTVHRWLGSRGRNRQPVDALILDEGSMVDLTLMARVLAALPSGARLVMLGDASQLASVQPGAVFADLCRAGARADGTEVGAGGAGADGADAGAGRTDAGVAGADAGIGGAGIGASDAGIGASDAGIGAGDAGIGASDAGVETGASGLLSSPPGPASSPLVPCVVQLVRNWRFDETGGIGRLAAAVMRGDASAAVAALRDASDDATELRPLSDAGGFERLAAAFADERFAPALRAMQAPREPGRECAPPSSFRVLCAHRTGPFGTERFNRTVERRLRVLGLVRGQDAFYPGRPILVTRNDPRTGLSNGDTGVVLCDTDHRTWVWFPELEDAAGRPRLVAPVRLPPHESFFAVTVHRAQGSEYDEVAVVPGPAESRVATRELLYTAVTRARRRVVVYGTGQIVGAAVERATERSSGLREALARPVPAPG